MTSDAAPKTASRRRLKWSILLVGWAVLLLVLGVWSAFNGPATVREQTSIGSAKGTIDQTVGRIAGALPGDWRLSDQGYTEDGCELSVAHDGVSTARWLKLSGPAGSEKQVLAAVAASSGDSSPLAGGDQPTAFFSDAGNYVAVVGKVTGAGQLDIELRSGCRTE